MEAHLFRDMARLQDEHWWFAARRSILERLIRTLDLPAGARILELGCGTGANFQVLSRFGTLTAIEADAFARENAAARLGRPVQDGRLPDGLPPGLGTFDLVCLLDVLEHIEPDVESLAAVGPLLAPGGRVVLTVPACAWLYGAHDRVHGHRRRYSAAQLRSHIEAAGLTVQRLGYFNSLLFPIAVAARLFERSGAASSSGGDTMPPAPVNALLRSVFAAEAPVVARTSFPISLSLFAVCANGPARTL